MNGTSIELISALLVFALLLLLTSTGLNVFDAIELAKEIKPEQRIVSLACDSGLKYLGGHIYG